MPKATSKPAPQQQFAQHPPTRPPATPMAASPGTTSVVAADEHGGYRPPSAEWALVLVTVVLAFYTYRLWAATKALVTDTQCASARQAAAMEEQRKVMAAQQLAMEQQAATAHESSRVLMTQALAMDAIATAVAASAHASKEAVDAVKAQVTIATRQLVANNPPIIDLRAVEIDMERDDWTISFSIINVGGTPATVDGLEAFDEWSGLGRPLPRSFDYKPVRERASGTVLAPGSGVACTHVCRADSMAINDITSDNSRMANAHYYFLVRCAFDDDNQVRRVVNFSQRFDKTRRMFAPVERA